jgi:hypothetical protein
VTRSISFPATVSITDAGFSLRSEFTISRSEFDISFGPDQIEDPVAMTVTVGG